MTRRIAIALGLVALAMAGCAQGTTTRPTITPPTDPAGPQYDSGDRMGSGGGGGGGAGGGM
ncbi:MAG: hypothetical protein WB710_12015 [Stellaceae bacterium]